MFWSVGLSETEDNCWENIGYFEYYSGIEGYAAEAYFEVFVEAWCLGKRKLNLAWKFNIAIWANEYRLWTN